MDIIEVEVFNKLFSSIAEEMGIILTRSSFSSNIKERQDFSCAIFDQKGELVAQAAHIPVHLGAMPQTVSHALGAHSFKKGDTMIINDPFQGGSHLPDITLIEPVFDNDELLFYVASRAHHADVGGSTPGSMGHCSHFDEEGVCIGPTLLYQAGALNENFLSSFLSKVRNPEERRGDLQAQKAALKRGRTRLLEVVGRHGSAHAFTILSQLKAYGENLMRHVLTTIPDGTYSFTDYLDNDGTSNKAISLHVDLEIHGDEAIIDFSRCAEQIQSPLNAVRPVTISATIYVFQCLIGDGFPINQGSYSPLTIKTRPGSLLDARRPAPVAAGNVETSQRIVDLLFGALAKAIPDRVPAASCGSMNNIAIGGHNNSGSQFTYYETIGGGMGGRPSAPGLNGIHTHMTNTLNTPVEALEHSFPMMVEEYSLRRNSGGKGQHPGGDGIIRTYHFLADCEVSLLTDRRDTEPYGLQGGESGKPGGNILHKKNGSQERLPGKINFQAQKGERLTIKTPGGGGWGKKD
ncbi:MAG: hydantoinase B/oxoprolinase family protein [Thermodesulfobacteriota bacterium]